MRMMLPLYAELAREAKGMTALRCDYWYHIGNLTPKEACKGGGQNVGQGDHAIGQQILEQAQVPPGDLDSKLREIACQHKELLGPRGRQPGGQASH
jgi:hypothetical protein